MWLCLNLFILSLRLDIQQRNALEHAIFWDVSHKCMNTYLKTVLEILNTLVE